MSKKDWEDFLSGVDDAERAGIDDSVIRGARWASIHIGAAEAENERLDKVIQGYRKGELGLSRHPTDTKRIAKLEAEIAALREKNEYYETWLEIIKAAADSFAGVGYEGFAHRVRMLVDKSEPKEK